MPTTIVTYGALLNVAEEPAEVTAACDQALAATSTTTPGGPWVILTAMNESTYPYEPDPAKKVRIRAGEVHAVNDPQWQ